MISALKKEVANRGPAVRLNSQTWLSKGAKTVLPALAPKTIQIAVS